ncbi:MAG: hypothetical protein LBC27_10555 [Spirochaetaceae bacterium]|nr:hypothetical protein [Spirochaetaceae bacterium]
MSKKPILISIFIFLSFRAFSLELSTGYGLTLGANFDTLTSEINVDGAAAISTQRYNQFNAGGLVFFDATYVVIDISFYGTYTAFSYNNSLKRYTNVNDDYQLSGANLAFGFSVKYPFNLSGVVSLFPIIGVQGCIGLAQNFARDFNAINAKKGDNYGNAIDWSTVAVKAGCGVDVRINTIMFFRAEVLMNYKFESSLDKAYIDAIKKGGNKTTYNLNLGFEANILLGYTIGQNSSAQSSYDYYYPVEN